MLFEPDMFSNRTGDENHNLFIPCKSGNPLFSFKGMAASYNKDICDVKISLNLFYSINERFIDSESYESGFIHSSMGTIDSREDKAYNRNEPVNIYTSGGLFSIHVMDPFFLKLYYIFTNIKSQDKDEILWDSYETYNTEYGISRLLGSGFLAEYRDEFLNIFCEGSVTARKIKNIENEKEKIPGYGMLYGIRFKPPFLKLSLIGKQMDGGFYSPYSSSIGEDYPEDAFFFNTEISPFRNLDIGSGLSSQRKTAAGSRDDAIPLTERQKIYINYNYGMLEELAITARRIERSDDEGRGEKYQLKEKADAALLKNLKLNIASVYQYGDLTGHSRIYQAGMDISFFSKFRFSIDYASACISNGNNIYVVISPVPGSSTPGIMIQEDSNIIISKLDFRHNDILLSFRYLYQFTPDKSIHKRFEFSGSGRF
jgi:hypothetical protein